MRAETFICCYCAQLIDEDDDAQRISKREVAHAACAFAVNDAYFCSIDAESERER
jgi:hypothetical protein